MSTIPGPQAPDAGPHALPLRRIAFIGAGRIATTLAQAFSAQGEAVVAVAGRDPAGATGATGTTGATSATSAMRLCAHLPGARALAPQAAVDAADLVFLTVPDDRIAEVAASLRWRAGQAVVHCSGATEVAALDAAAAAGALTGGFHPLQSFADPQGALALLADCAVAIEGPPVLSRRLHALAQALRMRPLALPPGARARYHGAASYAASFLLSMLDEAVAIWRSFGIAEEDALAALLPLSRGVLENAKAKGLPGALAGPISRGDAGVLHKHLDALAALGPQHEAFYRELSRRQLDLARRSGRLDAEALERMQAAIEGGRAGPVA